MDTKKYMGIKFSKTIKVFTNDPKNKKILLRISGVGDKVVTITPKDARLKGMIGDNLTEVIKIVPEKKYAFKIKNYSAANDKNIRYSLKEVENSGYFEYYLEVTNTSKEQGQYFDVIKLKTNSIIKPVIQIRVFGDILANSDGT